MVAQRPPPRVVEQAPTNQVEMGPRAILPTTETPLTAGTDPETEVEDDYEDVWQHMTEELLDSFFPETKTETEMGETNKTRPESPLALALGLNETSHAENQSNKTQDENEDGQNQVLLTSITNMSTNTEFATPVTTSTPVAEEKVSEAGDVGEDPTTPVTPTTQTSTTPTSLASTSATTRETEAPFRGCICRCPRCDYKKRAEILTKHLDTCYNIIKVRKSFPIRCIFIIYLPERDEYDSNLKCAYN